MPSLALRSNGRGRPVDAAACLVAVRTYVRECEDAGRYPGLRGYEAQAGRRGWPGGSSVAKHLGSWRKALHEVGVAEPRELGGHSVTTAECLDAVRAYAAESEERGEYPGQNGYMLYAARRRWPSFTTVKSRLGPWTTALERAGVTPYAPDRQACLAALDAYVKECSADGVYPSMDRYRTNARSYGWPAAARVMELLGPWPAALKAAGFDRPIAGWGPVVTAEVCIAAIADYIDQCKITGDYPGTVGYDLGRKKNSWPDRHTCIYARLGSWPEALEAAGFVPKRARRQTVSRETCVAAVRCYVRRREEAGLSPALGSYQAMATVEGWPSRGTMLARLGSWQEALAAAAEPEPASGPWKASG